METDRIDRSWPFAEGGEPVLSLVSAILAGVIALNVTRPNIFTRILAAIGAVLWLLVVYFFRDPNRATLEEPGLVVSAADGEVVEIVKELEDTYLRQDMIRISVFLSIFDVHVQRFPVSGTVKAVERRSGKFLQAFRSEASSVNEHIAMVLETERGTLLVKQIAGILARRCVNRAHPGDVIRAGERYGMIRFGSRVDLFLPADAVVLVGVGDKVAGGISRVAELAEQA